VLPQDVRARVVGTRGADLHAGDDALLDLALEEYFNEERAAEQKLWDRVRDEYMRGGLAVVGAEDVLAAVRAGRVEALLVTRDAKIAGARCRACDLVHVGQVDQCAGCGAKDTFAVDLVEELVEHAQRTSATVEFADPIDGLREIGDVAATLRY
jgi:peptide subunit release factor 1 (eRF1)